MASEAVRFFIATVFMLFVIILDTYVSVPAPQPLIKAPAPLPLEAPILLYTKPIFPVRPPVKPPTPPSRCQTGSISLCDQKCRSLSTKRLCMGACDCCRWYDCFPPGTFGKQERSDWKLSITKVKDRGSPQRVATQGRRNIKQQRMVQKQQTVPQERVAPSIARITKKFMEGKKA